MDMSSLFPLTIINGNADNVKKITQLLQGNNQEVQTWITLWKSLVSIEECPVEYLVFLGKQLGISQGSLTYEEYRILLRSYFYHSNSSINSILSYFLMFFEPDQVFLDTIYTIGIFLDGSKTLNSDWPLHPQDGNNPFVLVQRKDLSTPLSPVFPIVAQRIRALAYPLNVVDWFIVNLDTPHLEVNFDINHTGILNSHDLLDGSWLLSPDSTSEVPLQRIQISLDETILVDKELETMPLPYDKQEFFVCRLKKQNTQFNKIEWIGVNQEVLLRLEGDFSQTMCDLFLTFPKKI